MLLSDFESEDIALLASISITALIVFIDTVYGSPIFKALKIISVILSVGLAIQRVKTSKPYYKEILESDWIAAGDEYVTKIAKSEHNRGKFPHVRCLVPGESGGYSECFTDGEVDGEGNIVIQIGRPGSIRVEVRK